MKSKDYRSQSTLFLCDLISNKTSLKSVDRYLSKNISIQDKSLAKAICFGVCRNYYKLDFILKDYIKSNTKLTIKAILYIGMYQLLYMSQPSYAVINESVEAAKKLNIAWASGLINAVLRKVVKNIENKNKLPISIEMSFPDWLYLRIRNDYPDSWQEILKNSNDQAPMYLRVDTQQISLEEYLIKLKEVNILANEVNGIQSALCLDEAVSVERLPGFYDGLVSVQDISAQRAVEILPIHSNDKIIDACSAPGGKAIHLLQKYPDVSISAIEFNHKRISKIYDNLARCQIDKARCKVIEQDMSQIDQWWQGGLVDVIFLDAPCSATGVIRRQPDIKLLRTENEVDDIVKLQQQILQSAWQVLKQGGCLLYCTCSILKQENSEQINLFLQNYHDAKLVEINSLSQFQADLGYQVLPSLENGDGFYYALLQKNI